MYTTSLLISAQPAYTRERVRNATWETIVEEEEKEIERLSANTSTTGEPAHNVLLKQSL